MNEDKSNSANQSNAKALARRRLIKGSLTAPVAMTLFSNPVSAGTCINASAFASAAAFVSNQARNTSLGSCTAQPPTFWRDQPLTSWPTSCTKSSSSDDDDHSSGRSGPTKLTFDSKKFKDIFDRQGVIGKDDTLLDVLKKSNPSNKEGLAKRIVALHLNCESKRLGTMVQLSTDDIRKIWNDICTVGEYSPKPGTKLDIVKVNTWLDRMWTT